MTSSPRDIAQKFVGARREGKALPDYPGEIPADLSASYRVQEQAIALLGEDIVGWKIGRVAPDWQERVREERLAGPIFKPELWQTKNAGDIVFQVYEGGFAAVEAEYVYRLGADAPAGKTDWSADEAAAIVAALHIGVECAGSPLATINDLGPKVVVSDFGNNHGLILGPEIPNWRTLKDQDLRCETFIDGKKVGAGGAASIPSGGPMGALVWVLGHLAARGRPLKAGQLVTTGAATGIHDIVAGQKARVDFDGFGEISCVAVKAIAAENRRTAAVEPG